MAVLITGGAGYIGSHTCVEVLTSGREVVVIDNFSNSSPEALRRIKLLANKDFAFYEGDILDINFIRDVFSKEKIDSVIHFAALKAVGESVEKPIEYYMNNINGTLNLCSVMREFGCKKLVFSSSATVYGLSDDVSFREDAPISATNPYGMTKVMIEQVLGDIYAADNEWSIALLRYFNPIGAHPSGLLGEDPAGIPNNLVPYIANVAVGKLDYLQVFGDDYDTKDGTGVRDYLHVVDLAKGHNKAIDFIEKNNSIEAINLGTGIGYSVLDILKAYEKACGKSLPYKVVARRPGDIATCYADASKAKRLLGWEAQKNLDQMCADSWNFVCNVNKA